MAKQEAVYSKQPPLSGPRAFGTAQLRILYSYEEGELNLIQGFRKIYWQRK